MSIRILTILLALVLGFGTAADAKKGGRVPGFFGYKETLTYVADFPVSNSTSLAICTKSRQDSAFGFMNFGASHLYVLSDAQCNGTGFYNLPPEKIEEAVAAGVWPETVPVIPANSPAQWLIQNWGSVLIAMLILFAIVKKFALRPRKKDILADFPLAHGNTIRAMISTVRSDGELDGAEVDMVQTMLSRITNRDVSEKETLAVIVHAQPAVSKMALMKLGRGLTLSQKVAIFKASHAVAGCNGVIEKSEITYLKRLAKGLKLPNTEIEMVLAR